MWQARYLSAFYATTLRQKAWEELEPVLSGDPPRVLVGAVPFAVVWRDWEQRLESELAAELYGQQEAPSLVANDAQWDLFKAALRRELQEGVLLPVAKWQEFGRGRDFAELLSTPLMLRIFFDVLPQFLQNQRRDHVQRSVFGASEEAPARRTEKPRLPGRASQGLPPAGFAARPC